MPDTEPQAPDEREWTAAEIEERRHAAPPNQPRVIDGIGDVDQTPDLFPLGDLDDGGPADGQ